MFRSRTLHAAGRHDGVLANHWQGDTPSPAGRAPLPHRDDAAAKITAVTVPVSDEHG